MAWSVVGGVLARRAPGAGILPLVLLVAAVSASAAVGTGWELTGAPGAQVGAWWSGWTWLVGVVLPLTLVLLRASRDGPLTRVERVVTVVVLAGLAVACTGIALGWAPPTAPLPTEQVVTGPAALAPVLVPTGMVGLAVAAVASVTVLAVRLRRAEPSRRRQLAPVLVGAAVTLLGLVLGALVPAVAPLVQVVTTPALPLSVGLAVLGFRLYDAEGVLRRSVVLAGSLTLLIGGYAVAVAGLTAVVGGRAGAGVAVVLAVALALAFLPLLSGLQRVVSRALYGDRDVPQRALRALSAGLEGAADPATAVRGAVEALLPALRVPWAAVVVDGATVVEAGVRGPGAPAAQEVPLVHLGHREGALLVAARSAVDPLGPRDLDLLTDLARPVAAVLASARLLADLRRSHRALLLAREEERRRVRRDLHDDVGPLLSAILTQADVAVLALDRTPEATRDRLLRLHAVGRQALASLRRVTQDLGPLAVDDLGLGGALQEVAADLSGDTLRVVVEADPDLELPAATELAAYRIAAEAMGNAARHAGATEVRVGVRGEDRTLRVTVVDDGHGFDPAAAAPGVGLVSMRERATDLGGVLEVTSGATGTRVEAALPLPEVVLT
ncbi:sensor histidine kinase [Desertihabitans brevis]|uniref:histidine kinase n=1 Tax=Desertihabitans brevis TaxID=2268447 RepID=A0A367YZ89_9ACTN|nr:sensor histidine kinase [Desertihabitans brevis]